MSMFINLNVTILGGDHYNTYGIVRSLGEMGVLSNVVILGTSTHNSFVLKSKYVNQGVGVINKPGCIEKIIQFAGKSDNILICCSDEAVELIINNYDKLNKLYILPVCANVNFMLKYMSKSYITKMAEGCDLIVPKTWTIIDRQIPDKIEYPCITKPEKSTKGKKSDIVICNTQEELEHIINDEHRCSDFVVQQLIKYDKEISILGAVLADGKVVFSGCIEKIRTCMIGTSSFAKMVDNALLGRTKNKLEELLKKTGYRGLFSAEFLQSKDNFYFLEVNFRNDGNTYVATASGLNLPYIWINSYFNLPVNSNFPLKYPCYFMLDIEDLLSIKRNCITYKEWREDMRKSNIFLVYNKKDKKPFVKKISNTIQTIIKTKIRIL